MMTVIFLCAAAYLVTRAVKSVQGNPELARRAGVLLSKLGK